MLLCLTSYFNLLNSDGFIWKPASLMIDQSSFFFRVSHVWSTGSERGEWFTAAYNTGLGTSRKKMHLLNVNAFSTKVLIRDTSFMSPTDRHFTWSSEPREGLATCNAKGVPYFSVILRPWVLVRSRESNPRPPALQSRALPTGLILPRLKLNNSHSLNNKLLYFYLQLYLGHCQ